MLFLDKRWLVKVECAFLGKNRTNQRKNAKTRQLMLLRYLFPFTRSRRTRCIGQQHTRIRVVIYIPQTRRRELGTTGNQMVHKWDLRNKQTRRRRGKGRHRHHKEQAADSADSQPLDWRGRQQKRAQTKERTSWRYEMRIVSWKVERMICLGWTAVRLCGWGVFGNDTSQLYTFWRRS